MPEQRLVSSEFRFAAQQQRCEIGTVEEHIPGFVDSQQPADRRQHVNKPGGFVLDNSADNVSGPMKDAGDSDTAFVI